MSTPCLVRQLWPSPMFYNLTEQPTHKSTRQLSNIAISWSSHKPWYLAAGTSSWVSEFMVSHWRATPQSSMLWMINFAKYVQKFEVGKVFQSLRWSIILVKVRQWPCTMTLQARKIWKCLVLCFTAAKHLSKRGLWAFHDQSASCRVVLQSPSRSNLQRRRKTNSLSEPCLGQFLHLQPPETNLPQEKWPQKPQKLEWTSKTLYCTVALSNRLRVVKQFTPSLVSALSSSNDQPFWPQKNRKIEKCQAAPMVQRITWKAEAETSPSQSSSLALWPRSRTFESLYPLPNCIFINSHTQVNYTKLCRFAPPPALGGGAKWQSL